jgi:hypothetical protein
MRIVWLTASLAVSLSKRASPITLKIDSLGSVLAFCLHATRNVLNDWVVLSFGTTDRQIINIGSYPRARSFGAATRLRPIRKTSATDSGLS